MIQDICERKNSHKRGPSLSHVCALPYIRSTFDLYKYTLMRQITHENAILVYDLYYYGKVWFPIKTGNGEWWLIVQLPPPHHEINEIHHSTITNVQQYCCYKVTRAHDFMVHVYQGVTPMI